MDSKYSKSFYGILKLARKLPADEKIKLLREMEKELIQARMTELLKSFRTDDLTEKEISEAVEKVRAELYSLQQSTGLQQSFGAWKTDESADELIALIRKSRNFSHKN